MTRQRVLAVALDRAARGGPLAVPDDKGTGRAIAGLPEAVAAAPVQVTPRLTDRGAGFPAQGVEAAGRERKGQPRPTQPTPPQTTGRVERCNGRGPREGLGLTVHRHADLETRLTGVNPALSLALVA